jgi:hypothetical protein
VNVKLRDINDNKPLFEKANIETSVYENAEVGKSLETFRATDPDQGGKSKVSFAIDRASDRRRQFAINQNGTVTIQRHLDREDTPRHQVKILAIDDGVPPKTATATLTVIVQDINDNAPRFLKVKFKFFQKRFQRIHFLNFLFLTKIVGLSTGSTRAHATKESHRDPGN